MRNDVRCVLVILVILLSSCGGGGSDSTATSGNQPPNQTGVFSVTGSVVLSEEIASSAKVASSPGTKPYPGSSLTQYAANMPGEVSIYDLACYLAVADVSQLIPDIDTDSDGAPDINITNEGGSPYKNISLATIGLTSIDQVPDITLLTADKFLYDLWIGLEPNKDSDSDGVADLNITSSEGIILTNIDVDADNIPDINIKADPALTQYLQTISYLNRDIDYDGQPDINLDIDYDGIAETNIDENNDCIGDFSVVSTGGATVAGATVELLEPGTKKVLHSGVTNEAGRFEIDDVVTGTYFLKILATRGGTKYWNLVLVNISSSNDLGTYRVSTGPLIVGLSGPGFSYLPYESNSGPNTTWRSYGHAPMEIGSRIEFVIYAEDPNGANIFHAIAGYDGSWYEADRLNFTDDPETGTQRLKLSFIVEQDGCLWEQTGGYQNIVSSDPDSWRWCSELSTRNIKNIEQFWFSFDINNDDGKNSMDRWRDAFVQLNVHNDDFSISPEDLPGATLQSITLNGTTYQNEGPDPRYGMSINYAPDSEDLRLNMQTVADVLDPAEYLWVQNQGWNSTEGGNGWELIGQNSTKDFSEYKPAYTYRIQNIVCSTPIASETCVNQAGVPNIASTIRFTPLRAEKPPVVTNLLIDGKPYRDVLLSSNQTAEFKAVAEDPNGLTTIQVQYVLNGRATEWVPINQGYSLTILPTDVFADSKIWVNVSNNDGVASSWIGDGTIEFDGNRSFFLTVTE